MNAVAAVPATTSAPASRSGGAPFNPRVVLALILFGAAAFLATLYFIGSGQTGQSNNGGGHAASNGLAGYAGLAQLLDSAGHDVTLSRNPANFTTTDLLILTPPHFTDAEELADTIANRRYLGPTLIVAPKYLASEIPDDADVEAEDGWVEISGTGTAAWLTEDDALLEIQATVEDESASRATWRGLGYGGDLPDPARRGYFDPDSYIPLNPLITDSQERLLAGYLIDNGYYPLLDQVSGATAPGEDERDESMWNVTVVAEADLLNNYGMADRQRAMVAHALVDTLMEGEDLGVTFDLSLNGLGAQENLLTLAFRPPFLAATICLLIAMLVVGWRAFLRFGPPVAEQRAIAFGKTQLVANSAGLIQRTRRLHLLADPYIALVAARLAQTLGLRKPHPAAIDAALARRLGPETNFTTRADDLRKARRPKDILRAAQALSAIERKLTP